MSLHLKGPQKIHSQDMQPAGLFRVDEVTNWIWLALPFYCALVACCPCRYFDLRDCSITNLD